MKIPAKPASPQPDRAETHPAGWQCVFANLARYGKSPSASRCGGQQIHSSACAAAKVLFCLLPKSDWCQPIRTNSRRGRELEPPPRSGEGACGHWGRSLPWPIARKLWRFAAAGRPPRPQQHRATTAKMGHHHTRQRQPRSAPQTRCALAAEPLIHAGRCRAVVSFRGGRFMSLRLFILARGKRHHLCFVLRLRTSVP